MDDFGTYLIWMLIIISAFVIIRVCCTALCNIPSNENPPGGPVRRRVVQRIRIDPPAPPPTSSATAADRQANVFTVQDENSRESRYNDIFFIEPNSAEAARIRAQLEKDDKDLPSYEEVMRMTSVTTPTTTSAAGVTGLTASNASVNTTETILAVPPYSEVDPIAAAAATSSSGNNTSSSASAARTSTAPPPMPAAMVSTATDITHQASSVV
ncbi:uncharacterized protein LOC101894094 isoform X2 [Musca domestica]|uniref:Uncharacterized protein LOC101894094 isoform X2 n=1 Tax=Musca domestica TaxID=7370 RepID=A0A1I8MDB9_MUSDO|nr:uncharacterized protein LOC101894094 isoform X2 [Musca domestica]